VSRLGRRLRGLGGHVRRAGLSLGLWRTAAVAAGVLAAGVGGAVALTGGRSQARHANSTAAATKPSTRGVGQATSLKRAGHRAAQHHMRRTARHVKHGPAPKAAAKHGPARPPRPAGHPSATTHATQRTTTTTTTPTTTTSTTPSAASVSVTLDIHGGGNASLVACGSPHHFRTYAAGSTLSFSGTVQPPPTGQWQVKLHSKICQGGTYQDFIKVDAHVNRRTGAFHGTFSAPPPGLYEFEAVLYLGGTESADESGNVDLKTH